MNGYPANTWSGITQIHYDPDHAEEFTDLGQVRPENRGSAAARHRLHLAFAWATALLLPVVSTAVTSHLELLQRVPFTLFLASIAVTAWFGYTTPAAISILVSLPLYNYFIAPPMGHWSLQPDEIVRDAVLVLIAALIAVLNIRLRKTQVSLARSEAAYRTTLTSIGDAVIATDPDGMVTFMNPVAEELTGWAEGEVKNSPLASFFCISNEETGAPVENPVDKVRRLGTIVGMANHTNLERRDGTLVPIDDSGAPIRKTEGGCDGIVLVFRDVTERREGERQREILLARMQAAESELRGTVELYRDQVKGLTLAQQAGKSASWVRDVEHQEVRFLPGGFEIFGLPFADFGERRPISFVEAEDRRAIEAAFRQTLETGEPFQVEFRVRWPSGEMRCQEARGVRDAENPNLIRGTTFDITERKQAETSLLRIEKLAAVGRIASTIAHEINNPLASVTNLLYLALLDPALSEEVRGFLERAEEELSRLRNITRLTLSYARPHNQATDIDPGEVIDSVLSLFRMRLEAKEIRIIRACTEPFKIHIYLDELQRIFTNLLANAIDAVDLSGGVIRVALERRGLEAVIAIEDNGVGIPPERVERVFDPFFTSKEDVGTGIGLWVTKELVEKNGGTISLFSGSLENEMRTRFEMRFPVSVATQESQPESGRRAD